LAQAAPQVGHVELVLQFGYAQFQGIDLLVLSCQTVVDHLFAWNDESEVVEGTLSSVHGAKKEDKGYRQQQGGPVTSIDTHNNILAD
jgi:hypothetical protein